MAAMATVRLFWRGGGRKARAWFDGAWAWLDVHDESIDRGRRQIPLRTQDPARAAALLRLAEADLRRGRTPGSGGPSIAEAARAHLAHEKTLRAAGDESALSASTVRVREDVLDALDRLVGSELVERFGPEDVERLVGRLLADGKAPSTVRLYLNALSVVFRHAGVARNPVLAYRAARPRRTTKASVRGREISVLEAGAASRLLAAAAEHPDPQALGIVLHGLDAGLRLGEIRGRRWEDHAWGESAQDRGRSLIVLWNVPQGGDGPEATKTGKPRRVHMSLRLRAWLLAERRRQGIAGAEGPVFRDRGDRGFRGLLARLSARAGIEPVNFLMLRHTFASELLSAGFALDYIARQLGNSPAVCRQHYARWLHEDYVDPPRLAPGELPCDHLARVTGQTVTIRGPRRAKPKA